MTCFIFNFLDISGLHGLWDFFGIVINLQKFFQYICWKKKSVYKQTPAVQIHIVRESTLYRKKQFHNLCSEEANNLFVLFGFIELKPDNGWHCNVILAMSGLGTSVYVIFHGKKELFRVTHTPNGPQMGPVFWEWRNKYGILSWRDFDSGRISSFAMSCHCTLHTVPGATK